MLEVSYDNVTKYTYIGWGIGGEAYSDSRIGINKRMDEVELAISAANIQYPDNQTFLGDWSTYGGDFNLFYGITTRTLLPSEADELALRLNTYVTPVPWSN